MERTWILVADGSYARLFELGETGRWELLREFEHVESREHEKDLKENRPGKIQHREERTSRGANPVEFKAPELAQFAREISDYLNHRVASNEFDRLVVVSPPKMLGLLRDTFPTPVRQRVSVEIDKDYTEMKADRIAELVPVF